MRREAAELFAVRHEDLRVDERSTSGGIGFVRKFVREFAPPDGVDACLQRNDLQKPPFAISDALNERPLLLGRWRKFGEVALDVFSINDGVRLEVRVICAEFEVVVFFVGEIECAAKPAR